MGHAIAATPPQITTDPATERGFLWLSFGHGVLHAAQ